jgi:hypothetical protein
MRCSRLARPVALLCLLGSGVHCSDDTAPSSLPECTGPVTLSVTTGTTPTFSWVPRCQLFFVIVEPAESGSDLWSIITRSENTLAPPVTYGEVPAGAEETDPPVPLEAGTAYKVAVARWTGPGDDDGEAIGMQTFTP